MRHSSPDLFAPFAARFRDHSELVIGRYGEGDVALQFTEARERIVASSRSVRQDDRPAGRMTLLPAE